MKRMKKSNRVSWAPGVNLCQVKLFVSEDCPIKVGVETVHSNGRESDELPPGFEGSHNVSKSGKQLSQAHIPQIKWKCPAKSVLNPYWHVVAGEVSTEAESQKLREMRVLEAIYPHSSATPPSPSVSLDIEKEHYDDSQTPLIPITPIEEEEAGDISSNLTAPVKCPISSQPSAMPQGSLSSSIPNASKCDPPVPKPPASEKPALGILTGLSNDVTVAASTALTAIMKSMEQGSMIDTDLLIKILGDPKMIEKLINDYGAPAKNGSAPAKAVSAPMFVSKLETGSIPLPCPKPPMVSSPMPANRNLSHVSNGVQPTPPQPVLVSKPSVLSSIPQANIPLAPRPPKGNLFVVPNQVQQTLSSMPVQFNSLPKVQPTLSMMPALPNSTPKVQPMLNTMPLQPHPVPKVQPMLGTIPLQPSSVPKSSLAALKANPVKDVNYIKQLIREHGGKKKENQDQIISQPGNNNFLQNHKLVQNLKPGELKSKNQKPCLYFKSSKGCRNGFSCPFQHDMSFQFQTGSIVEAPSAKRIKLGGEITGRT